MIFPLLVKCAHAFMIKGFDIRRNFFEIDISSIIFIENPLILLKVIC